MSATIRAWMTCTVVSQYRDEQGWIDPLFSYYETFESRNYARPLLEMSVDDEDLLDSIWEMLSRELGHYRDNGNSTFYAEDSVSHGGDNYTYAIQLTATFREGGKIVEKPWHPDDRA